MAGDQMKHTINVRCSMGWNILGNIWNIVSTQLNNNSIHHDIYSTERWLKVFLGGSCFTPSSIICARLKMTLR